MASSGAFAKKTVRDIDPRGRTVLMRVDFNVPLADADGGRAVSDDTRIRAALPTITYLRDRGAKLILVSHLGRPKGHDEKFSMAPVAKRLGELLGAPVQAAPDVVGPEVSRMAAALKEGDVLLLENSRFEPGEKKNDPDLARRLADLADIYVDDAFGSAHRAHATTAGAAELMDTAVAGFLMEREVTTLGSLLSDPARPFVVVLGGAKVTDKIGVIEQFLTLADAILIGGAMCFSFFKAQGIETGKSLVEEAGVELAAKVLGQAQGARARLLLPVDLVAGEEFSVDSKPQVLDGSAVPSGLMGLDIGPRTAAAYAKEIAGAGTVFWNGPMGAFELEPFAAGTKAVAEAIAQCPGTTVIGGGDSVAAIDKFGLEDRMTHVSTGGGASLELLEGKKLPGVEILDDAEGG